MSSLYSSIPGSMQTLEEQRLTSMLEDYEVIVKDLLAIIIFLTRESDNA